MAWIGAVVGAAASIYGANQANNAARGAGGVNLTSSNDPWYPSAGFRTDAMMRAYDALNAAQGPPQTGHQYPVGPTPIGWATDNTPRPNGGTGTGPGTGPRSATGGTPTGAGGGGAGPGMTHGATASTAPGKGRAGGAKAPGTTAAPAGKPGGGANAQPAFNGVSPETNQIRQAMIDRAQGGNPLYGESQDYISDMLSGDPSRDRNFYRAQTADYLAQEDPDLARYTALLFGSDTGLAPAQGQQGATDPNDPYAQKPGVTYIFGNSSTGGGPFAGSGGADMSSGPVGADKALRDLLAGKDAPGAQAMRDRIRRQGEEAYAEQAKQLRLRAAGSGMYGGTPYQQAEADALSDFGTGVTDALAAQDYNLYGQALGLGTSYDIAALDRAAAERSASDSASASLAAQQAELASRERMQRLDALGGAVGMGLQQNQFRASGFGSLGEGYSSDQQFALGQTPAITGLGLRDWGAAGDLSLGADSSRNTFNRNAADARNAGSAINLDRQRFNFAQYQYNREAPLNDIARYTDILNGASGAYGSRTDMGTDRRNSSPSYTNPGYAAISGAAAGYQLGNDIYSSYRGGR